VGGGLRPGWPGLKPVGRSCWQQFSHAGKFRSLGPRGTEVIGCAFLLLPGGEITGAVTRYRREKPKTALAWPFSSVGDPRYKPFARYWIAVTRQGHHDDGKRMSAAGMASPAGGRTGDRSAPVAAMFSLRAGVTRRSVASPAPREPTEEGRPPERPPPRGRQRPRGWPPARPGLRTRADGPPRDRAGKMIDIMALIG
jgi:hypothetical protein